LRTVQVRDEGRTLPDCSSSAADRGTITRERQRERERERERERGRARRAKWKFITCRGKCDPRADSGPVKGSNLIGTSGSASASETKRRADFME